MNGILSELTYESYKNKLTIKKEKTTQYRSLRSALITIMAEKQTLPVIVTTNVSCAQAITQL